MMASSHWMLRENLVLKHFKPSGIFRAIMRRWSALDQGPSTAKPPTNVFWITVFSLPSSKWTVQNKDRHTDEGGYRQVMDQRSQFIRIDWNDIKARALEIARYLPSYFRNPIESIRRVPSWDWTTAIILQVLISITCGVLGGLVARSFLSVFVTGVFVRPVMGLIATFLWTTIFYYAFIFIEKLQLEYRKIYVIVVLAMIPYFISGIFSPLFKPLEIIGIVASAGMLIRGFTDNFLIERKRVTRIVAALAILVSSAILINYFQDHTSSRYQVPDNYTPESLEQIQKEMGK